MLVIRLTAIPDHHIQDSFPASDPPFFQHFHVDASCVSTFLSARDPRCSTPCQDWAETIPKLLIKTYTNVSVRPDPQSVQPPLGVAVSGTVARRHGDEGAHNAGRNRVVHKEKPQDKML